MAERQPGAYTTSTLFPLTAPGERSQRMSMGRSAGPADRLDPVLGAMIVDENDHRLNGQSSSA
jgi:hypothetical protein